ncbi:MAG TPA: DUF4352 domain-containing protein [Micromonosporaceae bacterium]|nr:DUF4352 domain-containing protein [Micromonosporaceae bacterium]
MTPPHPPPPADPPHEPAPHDQPQPPNHQTGPPDHQPRPPDHQPGAGAAPPPPSGYQPAPGTTPPGASGYPLAPPKKRKVWLWVVLGIIAVLLLCCGALGILLAVRANEPQTGATAPSAPASVPASDSASGAAPVVPPAAEAPAAEPSDRIAKVPLGTPVRDGKFEFTVEKAACGQSKVGTDFLGATAQGQFCLVTLSVKNIGTKPQSFSDGAQKAYGRTGEEFGTDSSASLYANTDQQVWLKEINPGNTLRGVIVFDIPKDATIAELELHDSMFSGGAKVTVG